MFVRLMEVSSLRDLATDRINRIYRMGNIGLEISCLFNPVKIL